MKRIHGVKFIKIQDSWFCIITWILDKDAQSVLGLMVRPVFRYLKTGPKRPRSSSVSWSSQKITNIKNAFRWISRQPSVVERWIYYHSTRLDEAILMSCVRSFYNHWMTRYSTKRQQFGIYIMILRHLPFRWIARHLVIIKRRNTAHYNRLVETSRMVANSTL